MTYLEHLIENCLCDLKDGKSIEEIKDNIKNDVNLEYSGITSDQCWEICQYVAMVEEQTTYTSESEWTLEREPDGNPSGFCCSNCGEKFKHLGLMTRYKFCPICGCKIVNC